MRMVSPLPMMPDSCVPARRKRQSDTALTDKPYHDTVLFPFFDGLIPEGWLLNIAENSWKINRRDRMSLLLACCKDCIGAVSVVEDEPDKPET